MSYSCAVRRPDDCIDEKPYRCHHDVFRGQTPLAFLNILAGYLRATARFERMLYRSGYQYRRKTWYPHFPFITCKFDGTSYYVVRRILGHSASDVIKYYAKDDIDNLRLCSKKPLSPTERFRAYLSGKEVGGCV